MKRVWNELKDNIKQHKIQAVLTLIVMIMTYVSVYNHVTYEKRHIQEVAYVEFLTYLHDGDVDTVYYNKSEKYMTFTLLNDDTRDMTIKQRQKYEYSLADKRKCLYPAYDEFRKDVLESNTYAEAVQASTYMSSFLSLLGTLLFYGLLFFILMKAVNSAAKDITESDVVQTSDVKFDDIIGHEEILDDVRFITDLIQNPDKGDKIGTQLPKGILFTGPPGTGKTLLAKAIAHEAGVPFLYQNASGFIEMYVGLGAKRVRSLFKIAKKNAPCIVFIDEIDAIGGKRGESKGTSENEQTINAMLQEMDGFNGREGVFIIAATNRPESLDDALVRSGRFDRQITVNPPKNWQIRKELLDHYLEKFTVNKNVDTTTLAKQIPGFTGADIAMICNEASIIAVMKDKEEIDYACIEEAIDKKVFNGNRSKSESYEPDREIVAYHEAGHAVMTLLCGEPIARASIQSTTSGVGGAVFQEDSETAFQTNEDLKNKIMIAYAGRASEEIKFKSVTTGASNDITKATQIMLQYIEHLGFDSEFGLLDVSVLTKEHLVDSGNVTKKMSAMSIEIYDQCKTLLEANYDKVEKLAQKLLKSETLTGYEVHELLDM